MHASEATIPDEADYRVFYDQHFDAVDAFVRRRVEPSDVDDVVAQAFVVAWRRFGVLPTDDHDRRLWMYGVARRTVADALKAQRRRARLDERLRQTALPAVGAASDIGEGADDVLKALAGLRPADQEVLRLVSWEQLSRSDAARVLDCSVRALNVKLHRARGRLTKVYAALTPSKVPADEEVPGD